MLLQWLLVSAPLCRYILSASFAFLLFFSSSSVVAMSRIPIVIFFAIQAIIAALFLNRSPYVMTSTAPTKQWADGPMKLVITPQYQTKKVSSHDATIIYFAMEMQTCVPNVD